MVKISNVIRLPNLLKVPEFLLGLTVMVLARCGLQDNDNTYYLGWVDPKNATLLGVATGGDTMAEIIRLDAQNLCAMVGYGYVFIQLVLIVTVIAGERAPIQVGTTT